MLHNINTSSKLQRSVMFIEKTGKNISSSGAIYRRSIRRLQIKDYKIEYIANF